MSNALKRKRKLWFVAGVSGGGAAPITYLLRDDFTDTLAAGSVDGTDATPGPGTRTAIDTFLNMSIASGGISSTSQANNQTDPSVIYSDAPVTRSDGMLVVFQHANTATNGRVLVAGLSATQGSPSYTDTIRTSWNGNSTIDMQLSNGVVVTIGEESANESYQYAIWLSSTRTFYLFRVASESLWGLRYITTHSTATMYPFLSFYRSVVGDIYNFIRAADSGVLPTPLVSDGAFGATTDGLGHAETTGLGAGGSGLSWTDNKGTWAGGSATVLSGGEAIRTVDVGNANVFVDLGITRAGGNASIMLRYEDDSNYLRCGTDGTSMLLVEKVSGVENTLLTTTITYVAANTMRIRLEGQEARVYYSNLFVSATSSIDASLTGTKIGLYTTDTGNSFDNLVAYASTGYTELDQYVS